MGFINRFFCKTFDEEKKGYVTLGDFLIITTLLSIVAAIFLIAAYSIYVFFNLGAFNADIKSPEITDSPFFGLGVIFIILILFIIIGFILPLILGLIWKGISWAWNLKIAKCERR